MKKRKVIDLFPLLVLDEKVQLTGNLVLLTFDVAGAARILKDRGDVFVIDFPRSIHEYPINSRDIRESIIAIKNFDYERGVESTDVKRMELLEQLALEAPGKSILLLASIVPSIHFASGLDTAGLERWNYLLRGFEPKRLPDVAKGSPALVFSLSTISERIALLQIANEGWVNPRNEEAWKHLQSRGLIKGFPPQIPDPEFRKHVQGIPTSDRKSWEKHDDAAIWDGIRLTFVVLLFALVGAVLFLNQQTALSYVVAGLGVLTPLSRLLAEARGLTGFLGFGAKKQ